MTASRPLLKPFLQMAYAWALLVPASLAAFLLAPFIGGSRAFWRLARSYSWSVARVWGVQHSMEGWADLPAELRDGLRPAIYIANHGSNLDPIMLACHLPCRPAFVAKRSVAFVPVLGAVTWLSGAIFINRGNREQAVASMKRAAQRVRAGTNVVAFPEGTRSRTGALTLPFKKGVFNMAVQAAVPIVPVAVLGGFALLPPGGWRVEPGRIRLRVGQPLYPGDFAGPEELRLGAESAMASLLQG